MLSKFLWNASQRFQFQHDFRECPALQPLILLMNRLLHGILLWNLTTCLEELFYRTRYINSCFCHLISFRITLSMIHVNKSMQAYICKITCGSRTKIHLYIMDLYLSVAEPKVQFATHGKWQLKLGNCLYITSKGNETIKPGQSIEFIKRNIFLRKLCRKWGWETSSRSLIIFKNA